MQSPTLILAALALTALLPATALAAPDCPGKIFGKGRKAICLPLGALSFADRLVSFTPGAKPSKAPFNNGAAALGEPDYVRTSSPDFISIGCDGELTLQFTDNVLTDVAGMDLYVFEVGPAVEKTRLYISGNGSDWIDIGVIEGARADIDIAPFVAPGESFSYVRLVNAGTTCGGKHSGADIDAVAAVGSEIRLSLNSALLFDVGKSELKPQALAELDKLAQQLKTYGKNARVTLEGHTDSSGSDSDNQRLSEARAHAVWRYLATRVQLKTDNVKIRGYGETRPIISNETEENRALNRRVDLLIAPGM